MASSTPTFILRLAFVFTIFTSLAVATGVASANCTVPRLKWSYNNEGVSPCQVAADLGAVCTKTGDYTISPLPHPVNQAFYSPSPSPSECECNGVLYNLANACSLCQGGNVTTWNFWITNCTASIISLDSFPHNIPLGTNVPSWAYIDPSQTVRFNSTIAQGAGDSPESTYSADPTQVSDNIGRPASSITPTMASSRSSSNTSAIVGGAVGGVAFLVIACGLLFFFFRRKNSNKTHSPTTSNLNGIQWTRQQQTDNGDIAASPSSPHHPTAFSQRPNGLTHSTIFPGSPISLGGRTSFAIPTKTKLMVQQQNNRNSTYSLTPTSKSGYGSSQSQYGSTMKPDGYSGVAEI